MEILNVQFLEIILCAVLVSYEIEAHKSSHFCLFQNGLLVLLIRKGSYFLTKKYIKSCFEKNVEDRFLNFKPIFLSICLLSVVVFNMKRWLCVCNLSMSHFGFNIYH